MGPKIVAPAGGVPHTDAIANPDMEYQIDDLVEA